MLAHIMNNSLLNSCKLKETLVCTSHLVSIILIHKTEVRFQSKSLLATFRQTISFHGKCSFEPYCQTNLTWPWFL